MTTKKTARAEKENPHRKIIATVIILILAAVLLYAAKPFIAAFAGAIIFYALLNPVQEKLEKKMSKKKATIISMIIGSLIILVPISMAITLTAGELGGVQESAGNMIGRLRLIEDNIPYINISEELNKIIQSGISFFQKELFNAIEFITNTFIILLIMYFNLYYLLINREKIPRMIEEAIPFNKKNSRLLVTEFYNITHSVIVTTGIIAVVQGGLLAIGFWIFGLQSPLFWGFVTAILSFLPVVGPTLIWVPAGLILLVQGHIGLAIGIWLWGLVLSNIDNFIRPYLQQRKGKMHPLVSIIGVFLGLPLFGIMGLIMGPLLLSYFFLMINMFKEEYLQE